MKKLLFVYNADAGFFNAMTDYAHKIISPNTYSCQLCKITYSMTGMKKEWKQFLQNLEYEIEFLHRDEFLKRYPNSSHELPAVFTLLDDHPVEVLTAYSLGQCTDVRQLIQKIRELTL